MTLQEDLSRIPATSAAAAAAMKRLLDEKTKPPGSLGRLEEIAIRLAAIAGTTEIVTEPRAVAIFAADHGVTRRGVSPYPAEVTAQMVRNFASGGAAINVLSREMRARTLIVDLGVLGEPEWPPEILARRIAGGTRDFAAGPAMTVVEAARAVDVGLECARALARDGARLLATGEMGIGNTSAASALAAVFTGRPVEAVTGRGTGLDAAGLERKIGVVRLGLERNRPAAERPLEALAKVGGFEIAGLAGLVLGGALEGLPVILDGFIAGAAALVATALAPRCRDFLFAAHRSAETGHAAVLETLGLEPLLELDLRLGEGTGAVLALPLFDAAARIVREMATFGSAGISDRTRA